MTHFKVGQAVKTPEGNATVISEARGWIKCNMGDKRVKSFRIKNLSIPEAPKSKSAGMASQLQAASFTYVTLKIGKRKTRICGDEVSRLMAELSPDMALEVAAIVKELDTYETLAKYDHLNNGQRKMAATNLVRNAVNRGEVTIQEVTNAMGLVSE